MPRKGAAGLDQSTRPAEGREACPVAKASTRGKACCGHAAALVIRILVVIAAALSLTGCAAALPYLVGSGAGWAVTVGKDADAVLAADAPLKRAICADHPPVEPAWKAWCAHIATDVAGLSVQWGFVAIEVAK